MRAEDRRRPVEALNRYVRDIVCHHARLIDAGVTHEGLEFVEPRLQPVTEIRMGNPPEGVTKHRIPPLAVVMPAATGIRGRSRKTGHLTVGLRPFASGAERSDAIRISQSPGIKPEGVKPLAIVGARLQFQTPEFGFDWYRIQPEPPAITPAIGVYVSPGKRVEGFTDYRRGQRIHTGRRLETRAGVHPDGIVKVLPKAAPLNSAASLQSQRGRRLNRFGTIH